jgi:hypothetical protein
MRRIFTLPATFTFSASIDRPSMVARAIWRMCAKNFCDDQVQSVGIGYWQAARLLPMPSSIKLNKHTAGLSSQHPFGRLQVKK